MLPFSQIALVTVAFLLFIVSSLSWAWLIRKTHSMKLPPSPAAVPILGHLWLLKRGQPHQVLMDLSKKHGPIFSMKFGCVSVVVSSNHESAKEFLKTHDASFASRPSTIAAQILTYNRADMTFVPYGNRWRHLRRLATLELFTSKRVESFQQQREEEIISMLQSISTSVGSKVDLRKTLQRLNFNIITQMMMSKRYFGQDVKDSKEAEKFIHLIDEFLMLLGTFAIGDYLPFLRWLDLDRIEARSKALAAAMDLFLQNITSEREMSIKQKESMGPLNFVDIMLQLRDKGEQIMQGNTIKALMTNLFSAGIDTSSVTIEWAFAELVKQPSMLAKAQDEILSIVTPGQLVQECHISEMPYLQAIIKETFRLHPAAPLLISHEAMEDCKVMSYDIAAGSTIIINAYAVQRDPSVWMDPLEFKPERFFSSQVDVRGHDFELIPFGAGRRICPGMSLGLITVSLVLANLLHAFDWKVPPGEVIDTTAEKYGLTLPPAKNLELFAHPRL